HRPYKVVYAGRNAESMAYREEIALLAGDRARFHTSDSQGRVDLQTLLAGEPEGTTLYICGPAKMIEATQEAAARLNWAAGKVRSEMFGAGISGVATPFTVRLQRTGKTVQVGADVSILDALMAEGVPVLWDCRRGECGLCPLPVLSSNGPLQHHDRYLSDEEKTSGDTMCICVSRTCGSELVLDA
ncbi:MAG: iron-sulfur cluster-binding domain-containing protein, partial [Thiobacillus sp.]|nr:iron-sulfur cluster-binding domain-containing protein [Thiobacillus sp.]